MSFQLESRGTTTSLVSDDRDDYKIASAGDITATLTYAHLFAGILHSSPGAAITLTLPTAADLSVKDPKAVVGGGLHFYLRNDGIAAITVQEGAGGNLTGSASVAASANSHWYLYYTNVSNGTEAYEITRLG